MKIRSGIGLCQIWLFGLSQFWLFILSRFYSSWQIFETSTNSITCNSTSNTWCNLILNLGALGLISGRLVCCPEHRDEWGYNSTEVPDEPPVKIGKASKHLNVPDWLRLWPVSYSLDPFFFYPNTLSRNNKAQESYLIFMKSTLFQICIKAMFSHLF